MKTTYSTTPYTSSYNQYPSTTYATTAYDTTTYAAPAYNTAESY